MQTAPRGQGQKWANTKPPFVLVLLLVLVLEILANCQVRPNGSSLRAAVPTNALNQHWQTKNAAKKNA